MSTPNGRAGERPLVSVTGPAGFLFLPPRTDRKTQTRQSGAEVRAKNRTCKRRPRYSPGGRGPAPRSPSALCRSSPQLHPNHSAIASNYAFISELCLGTAPIFRRLGRSDHSDGQFLSALLFPPRHLEQSHLKFIRRLRFLCRWHSGSATNVGSSKGFPFRYAIPGRASLKQCRKFSCCR